MRLGTVVVISDDDLFVAALEREAARLELAALTVGQDAQQDLLPALPGQASGDLEVLLGKAACVVARQLDDDLAPTHLQVGVMAFRFG